MNLTELTIKQAHEGLKKGEFTSVDLTKAYLENIKNFHTFTPILTKSNSKCLKINHF